jgi:hypothetical protein
VRVREKIVLHSVQSTSNAVVEYYYYYYFVLERGCYFLAIEEQNFIFIWYGWNAFLILLYLMEGVKIVVKCKCRRVLCNYENLYCVGFIFLKIKLLRSIFGGRWMVQTRRTLVY